MQIFLECDDLMADKIIGLLQERIANHEREINLRLSNIDNHLLTLTKEIGELKGVLKPREMPSYGRAAIFLLSVGVPAFVAFAYHVIDRRLTALEDFVRKNGSFIAGLQVQKSASDPTNPKNLAELKQALQTAQSQKLKIDSSILNDAALKLAAASPRPPDFWATASELINYRSSLSGPQQHAKVSFQMRNCDPHPARDATITTPHKDGSAEIDTLRNAITITQENCFLDLDEHNQIEDYICHQCVIKYSGGQLTLKAPIEFKDCLFVFSIRSQPATRSGQLLAETLLSQDPQDVKIPVS